MSYTGKGPLEFSKQINIDSITAPAHSPGQLYVDDVCNGLNFDMDVTDVSLQIGKEQYLPPKAENGEATAITNGQVVYISGADGETPIVKLAKADAEITNNAVGVVTQASIAAGARGYVTTYGAVNGANTSGFTVGDSLWLSPTTAGAYTATKPSYPNFACYIGTVVKVGTTDGIILVLRPQVKQANRSNYASKSYSIADYGSADINYVAGFYEAPATSVTLTIGGTVTQTTGASNRASAAHAFCVASGAGGTDLVLTVSGTSINDAGVRTAGDSQVIVADTDQATTNQYFETSKKWIGLVTYTLTGTSGSFTFNYGLCKYEDFGNRNFMVSDFESVIKGGANTTNCDIKLIHHKATGWTYSATAFIPNPGAICSMATDYVTEREMDDEQYIAYKRSSLATVIDGADSEGVIATFQVATNNAIRYGTFHIGVYI